MKYFMTIAGSDNSGGAGIQQDLKVAENLGFWGLSVITGITVQDFSALDRIQPLPLTLVKEQFIKNIKSFPVSVIKIGALCSVEITQLITELLSKYYSGMIVVDPVLAPTKGKSFIADTEIDVYKNLLKEATIVTPNRRELELLTQGKAENYSQARKLAHTLVRDTKCKVYIKGGHFASNDAEMIEEYLITPEKEYMITKPKHYFHYSHGTGCYFASALACYLVQFNDLEKACQMATKDVSKYYKMINLKFASPLK